MKFFRSKLWILLLVLALTASIGACGYRPEPEKTEAVRRCSASAFPKLCRRSIRTPPKRMPQPRRSRFVRYALLCRYRDRAVHQQRLSKEYTVQPAAAGQGPALVADAAERRIFPQRNGAHGAGCGVLAPVHEGFFAALWLSGLRADRHDRHFGHGRYAPRSSPGATLRQWRNAFPACRSCRRAFGTRCPAWSIRPPAFQRDASQAKKSLAALVLTPETMTGSGLYIWDKYENSVLTLRREELLERYRPRRDRGAAFRL